MLRHSCSRQSLGLESNRSACVCCNLVVSCLSTISIFFSVVALSLSLYHTLRLFSAYTVLCIQERVSARFNQCQPRAGAMPTTSSWTWWRVGGAEIAGASTHGCKTANHGAWGWCAVRVRVSCLCEKGGVATGVVLASLFPPLPPVPVRSFSRG